MDILGCDAFVGIIRQYGISGEKSKNLLSSVFYGFLQSFRIRELITIRRTIGWFIEGLGMRSRQNRIREACKNSSKIIVEIPLGYTDFFAETYLAILKKSVDKPREDFESFLDISISEVKRKVKRRERTFVFIGQIGQIVRRQAIEALYKFETSLIMLRDGYGGVNNSENRKLGIGEEYVFGLMTSKISICPPGNISGNSYRIMESLICGAYPAVMSNVLCDPSFESPVIEVIKSRKPRTWANYLKKLQFVSEGDLHECILENIGKFKMEIEIAKSKLLIMQNRH